MLSADGTESPVLRKVTGDKNRKRSWRKNWGGVLRGEWKTIEAPEEQERWHCLGLGTSAGVCGAAPTLPAHVQPSLLLLKKRREGRPSSANKEFPVLGALHLSFLQTQFLS